MKFTAYGHPNITSKHKTTFEFTKDPELTLRGDCIIGVKADFSLDEIKEFIRTLEGKKIKIIVEVDGLKEEVNCEINPDFNSDKEMVIRKSDFIDERTFAIRADKASVDFDEGFVKKLKNLDKEIKVYFV